MRLVSELRRRNVLRMAVLYAVAAWLILQVAEVLIELAKLPDWIGTTTLWLLAIGFPIALIFSWFYEITPEGITLEKDVDPADSITRVTGRRLDFIVISLLCAAVILFAYDKWWIPGPPEQSIAVLAFENMSGDPDQEYFSDGISIELLHLLAPLPGLRVPARTSTFQFKGQNEDVGKIAAALHVAHVLEGSVRRSGDKLRINAQLIKADDGYHLWSGSYERDLDDVFAIQDEIARAICEVLKVELDVIAGETVLPTSIQAANTDAYDAYLRGRQLVRLRGSENLKEAIRHLERSLRLDNNFAPAYAHLAIATGLLVEYGAFTPEEALQTAIPYLDRAQALEPDLAEAHAGRALLAFFVDDAEYTVEHARKALALNPNYSDAMNWLQTALSRLGRYEESDAALRQMLLIDPLNIIGRYNYAELLSQTGLVDEAHELANQLLAQSPRWAYQAHAETSFLYEGNLAEGISWNLELNREMGLGGGYVMSYSFIWVGEYDEARRIRNIQISWIHALEGRWDEAIRVTQANLDLDPDNDNVIMNAALILYLAGRIDEALPLYERLREFVREGKPISGYLPLVQTMQLAFARRKAGDEDGAQAAAQIVRREYGARRAAGRKNQEQDLAEAMIAAFEHQPNGVIVAMKSATQRGQRFPLIFKDPIFEDLWGDPHFVALQQELNALLAKEHDKVLQLICFNNPTPDNWQPLPETCEGVEDQNGF